MPKRSPDSSAGSTEWSVVPRGLPAFVPSRDGWCESVPLSHHPRHHTRWLIVPPGSPSARRSVTNRPVEAERRTVRMLLVPDPTRSVVVLLGQRAAAAFETNRPVRALRLTERAMLPLQSGPRDCGPVAKRPEPARRQPSPNRSETGYSRWFTPREPREPGSARARSGLSVLHVWKVSQITLLHAKQHREMLWLHLRDSTRSSGGHHAPAFRDTLQGGASTSKGADLVRWRDDALPTTDSARASEGVHDRSRGTSGCSSDLSLTRTPCHGRAHSDVRAAQARGDGGSAQSPERRRRVLVF